MVPIDTPAVVSPGVNLECTGGHHPGGGDGKKLLTRRGTPFFAGSGGSQPETAAFYSDANSDNSDVPYSSFTEDLDNSSTWATESKRQSSSSSFPRRDEPLPSKIHQAATPSSSEKLHLFETLPQFYTSTFPSSNQRKRVTTEGLTRVTKRGRHGEVPQEQDVISP
ncbi:hypothetical protein L210DRAFT_177277 [Boletus edulis BED1]|uniref:Uncharacterized protein n=1 Tax=Boletus edulis BED1 TaxID=1328754 RepID=A0AAD4G7I6_BOLED|nr:hypothetical protein L210DRAFT_177277 [Boletus edulis BED1]